MSSQEQPWWRARRTWISVSASRVARAVAIEASARSGSSARSEATSVSVMSVNLD